MVLKNIEDLKGILKDILGYISKLYKQQLEFTFEKFSELYANQEKISENLHTIYENFNNFVIKETPPDMDELKAWVNRSKSKAIQEKENLRKMKEEFSFKLGQTQLEINETTELFKDIIYKIGELK